MSYKTLAVFGALFVAAIAQAGVAQASDTLATQCGASISRKILTDTTPDIGTDQSQFVPLPGAKAVITVPASGPHCIKVRFSASVTCAVGEAPVCYVEAVDSGNLANPQEDIALASASERLTAHSFEWVRRASPGTHTISIMIRLSDTRTDFRISGWTMRVELTH